MLQCSNHVATIAQTQQHEVSPQQEYLVNEPKLIMEMAQVYRIHTKGTNNRNYTSAWRTFSRCEGTNPSTTAKRMLIKLWGDFGCWGNRCTVPM
eukprot:m.100697 g.100697  ORF g.100697 m.100697 type:complete len:94 (+) comp13179_c0_seq8:886-1167(+)